MQMMNKELIELTIEVKRNTAKAILATDGLVEAWIPKSQIHSTKEAPNRSVRVIPIDDGRGGRHFEHLRVQDVDEATAGEFKTIEIPYWLAKKNGFV